MSTFLFSGIDRSSSVYLLACDKAAGMVSFLDWSRPIRWAIEDTGLEFAVDSGSYSKRLTREDIQQYAALIEMMEGRALWYAAPDVIGNQEESERNYQYLCSLLPRYLHNYILWIYQYGADSAYLHRGLEQHKHVGIGGLVPLLKSDPQQAEDIILHLASIIQSAGVTPQYFGCGVASIVKSLSSIHEDFSVDNTTWLIGGKYGLAIDARGHQRIANDGGYDWDKKSILRQNVRTMQKWVESPVQQNISYSQQGTLWEVQDAS